jgi:leucyl-tRNA synthetase
MNYDHKKIEKKWQEKWEVDGVYKTLENSDKPKQLVLDMFPYPSGVGLHVGHPRGFIATDVFSRMKRMQGFNVLHPMGWDAFGLPAENFAIANKVHPRVAVEKNIQSFKDQLGAIGFDYDWSREIKTTDPEFYKWTQWTFLKMYEKGLAYESNEPVNWCPVDKTVLANEDVESDGTCERCGAKVEKKPMRQWVLKITDYADRMLADLDKLPKWPDGVKEAQRNWIGKKEGVVISHQVEGSEIVLDAFSAYPAWLFADTYLVLAPEHPLVTDLIKDSETKSEIENFITEVKNTPEIERGAANKEKKGVFTGKYAVDPINQGAKMPIWIANFAMMGFGTGIIRCSAHDIRDYQFATKYNIPLKEVVARTGDVPIDAHENTGVLVDSGPFTGKNISQELIQEMVNWFVAQGYAKRQKTYRLKDWVFSRQRYWGEPIPMIHCEKCGVVPVPEKDLPVTLPDVESYEPTGTGESPLANISEWVNVPCPKCAGAAKRETNTMPQWAGSSWYYLRYIDPKNNNALVDPVKEKHWMPVDVYAGADHATRHLIYARFWHKFLFDIGTVSTEEPFPRLEFLGYILAENGKKFSKRDGNGIDPVDVINQFGADAFRLYEMFIGPFEQTALWNSNGMVGTLRFVERVWRINEKAGDSASDLEVQKILNKTIKKVGEHIEGFKFNTAVSAFMILANAMESAVNVSKNDFKKFIQILAPFAPHVTEELWVALGEEGSIHTSTWPSIDATLLTDDTIVLGVQVNGKVRAEIELVHDATEDQVREMVMQLPEVIKWMDGKEVKKFIFIPKKIISIVV